MGWKQKGDVSQSQIPTIGAQGHHEERSRHSSVPNLSRAFAGVADPDASPYSLPPVTSNIDPDSSAVIHLAQAINTGGDRSQRMLAYRADATRILRHDIDIWRARRDAQRRRLRRFQVLEGILFAVVVTVAFAATQIGLVNNTLVRGTVIIGTAVSGAIAVARRLVADPTGQRADFIRRLDLMISITKSHLMLLERTRVSLDTLEAAIATLQVAHSMLDTRNRDRGA